MFLPLDGVGGGGMRGSLVALLVVLASGCSALSADRTPPRAPSEAMERSARMLRQLDRLEADLHGQSAETRTFAVLVDRHSTATQVACQVSDSHVREIERLDLAQRQKRQEKLNKKHRAMASASLSPGTRLASR